MVRFHIRKAMTCCIPLLATNYYVSSFMLSVPKTRISHQQSATIKFWTNRRTKTPRAAVHYKTTSLAFSASSSPDTDVLPDIQSMRIGELKKELESYGISTKSFLEKKELIEALTKARADGLKPKEQQEPSQASTSSSTASASSSTSSNSSTGTSSSVDSRPRKERLEEEIANCQKMKASELKKELQDLGIDCKSFFEKPEFVHALAEARVDGVQKKSSSSSGGEGYAEYSNVEVLTDDKAGPRPKESQQPQQEQQQQSNSPFGNMGGMGGMGGIADILKNFGGVGGAPAGGNPFGGASPFGGGANPFGGGANPFAGGMGGMGDVMGKAQQMMSNPKVREIVTKAQSNPRIMAKVNECMSNPASIMKYQNDPEVAELITELKKYL